MLTDLAAVLTRAGLSVWEMDGWKTRANNGDPARFKPRGQMPHHDAMAFGWDGDPANDLNVPRNMIRVGQGGANTWWPRDPAVVGFDVAVLGAGPMPHAGDGRGWGAVPADAGNQWCFSHEVDITTGIAWPAELLARFIYGTAVLHQHYGWSVDCSPTHAEYAPGRKRDPDPEHFDADAWRAHLTMSPAILRTRWLSIANPTPIPTPSKDDDMTPEQYNRLLDAAQRAAAGQPVVSVVDDAAGKDAVLYALGHSPHKIENVVDLGIGRAAHAYQPALGANGAEWSVPYHYALQILKANGHFNPVAAAKAIGLNIR